MKTLNWLIVGSALLAITLAKAPAQTETNSTPAIGVYDSRVVAYAHFWSAPCQKVLQEQMSAARAAKNAGDEATFKKYDTLLRASQDRDHREVFSIAPAEEAMAALKARLPEIQKQAGVTNLVSIWEKEALAKYKDARQIDVTDQLVREFIQPTQQQAQVIESIKKTTPLSLDECDELLRKGQL